MGSLAALVLATPIWGLALQPPLAAPSIVPDRVAQVRTVALGERERSRLGAPVPGLEAQMTPEMEWTRYLSVAAVAGFGVTLALGAIQFADEYGFHDDYFQTACANGDAVFDDYCGEGTPWPHLTAALTTAALGIATLLASTQVDYDVAERVDGDWRLYEVTRWVGLATVGIQAIGGFLLANAVRFGWADEQRDFDTLQAFAGAHLAWGVLTAGFETFSTVLLF